MQGREVGSKQIRGARLVAKVLEATLAELASVGIEHLSIEDVALRAAVNKTTIYRRWPNAAQLARAALLHKAGDTFAVPDTGSLRADLSDFIAEFRALIVSPGMLALMRMHMGGTLGGEIGTLALSIQGQKDRQAKLMFERAVSRNELPRNTDIDLLYEALVGALLNLTVFRAAPASAALLERVADMIVTGAQNGGGQRGLHAGPSVQPRSRAAARGSSRSRRRAKPA
jgi:AcrR family transcriptional regulator